MADPYPYPYPVMLQVVPMADFPGAPTQVPEANPNPDPDTHLTLIEPQP